MRLSVVLGFAACFLLPLQSQAAWDIFQSYVIIDSGSGNQYLAGGINSDGASAFAGTDLGDFTAAGALTLKGGELKTYKNGSSNVCGGNLNYRVYASGDAPGAYTALALPFSANLSDSDQKWAATGQTIDLLDALTAGDYVLELYWEADGNDINSSGCGETKYDSDSGSNFKATFSVINSSAVEGCTDDTACNYDATATNDDGSCESLSCAHCTEPDYLTIVTQNASSSLDQDGTATLSTSEGTANWTIQRDGETLHMATSASEVVLSGLAPGAYLVQLQSDSGCETQATFSIGAAPTSFHERQFFEHDSNSDLGRYVHIEDTIAIAGAEGVDEVHVYHLNADGNWYQAQVLNGPSGSDFGEIVLVADGRLFIGADEHSSAAANSGAVMVFEHDGDSWNEVQTIENPAPIMWAEHDQFGNNVAYANEILYVGSPDSETETTSGIIQTGAVYAFGLNQGQWELLDTLVPDGLDEYAFFGQGLAASGNFICAGGPDYDEEAGCAASWSFDGSTFTQLGGLIKASDAEAYDGFGWELDVDGNTMVVGAPWRNADAGAAYIFEYAGNEGWVEMELLTPNDLGDDDNFGDGIELDNNLLLIGAWDQDIATDESAEGALYSSFIHNETGWEPFELLIACGIVEESEFGRGVSQSGGHLIIGANERNAADGSVSDIGGVYFFSLEEPTSSLISSTTVASCEGQAEGSISAEVDGLGDVTFHWTGPDNDSGTPYQSSTEDAQFNLLSGLYPGDYQLQLIYASGCDLSADITVPTTPQGQNGCPIIMPGCTDPAYLEFDASANVNDSSCTTLIVEGCTDSDYTEYNSAANTDDSSCETLSRCSSQTIDGYIYSVVEIGDQCWFAENLRSAVYADGSAIPEATNYETWSNLNSGGQSTYDNDPSNLDDYGRLYNWHAVEDNRGLCPSGYSVPDDSDVQTLIDEIGGQGALKLKSISGWTAGPNGTDDYGFDGRPAGYRGASGSFANLTTLATWWTSSPNLNGGDAHVYSLIDNSDEVYRQYGISRQQGRSIRCVQNILEGCTDPEYIEFDVIATSDNGSCANLVVLGCTDSEACNYDASANSDDSSCILPAELTSVSLVSEATTLTSTDGEISIVVGNGTPVSVELSGNNSSSDYSFAYPGTYGGIAAGYYSVTLLDASSCSGNAINMIIPYTQCCNGCGIYDSDTDGICDDEDNCTDRTAPNYNDPNNADCIVGDD